MDNFNPVKEFLSENWLVLLLSPESWWSENRYFDWSVSLFKLMFPIITGSIPPIQTSSESFLLAVTFGPVEFLFGFLASKTWYCKISKSAFDIDSSRYSNTYFSQTTGFLSSINFSIESYLFLGDYSICKWLVFFVALGSWYLTSSKLSFF